MNGLARYARDMKELLAESVIEILAEPSIMAMQEVPAMKGTSTVEEFLRSDILSWVSMAHTDVVNNLVFFYTKRLKLTRRAHANLFKSSVRYAFLK